MAYINGNSVRLTVLDNGTPVAVLYEQESTLNVNLNVVDLPHKDAMQWMVKQPFGLKDWSIDCTRFYSDDNDNAPLDFNEAVALLIGGDKIQVEYNLGDSLGYVYGGFARVNTDTLNANQSEALISTVNLMGDGVLNSYNARFSNISISGSDFGFDISRISDGTLIGGLLAGDVCRTKTDGNEDVAIAIVESPTGVYVATFSDDISSGDTFQVKSTSPEVTSNIYISDFIPAWASPVMNVGAFLSFARGYNTVDGVGQDYGSLTPDTFDGIKCVWLDVAVGTSVITSRYDVSQPFGTDTMFIQFPDFSSDLFEQSYNSGQDRWESSSMGSGLYDFLDSIVGQDTPVNIYYE